MFESRMSVMERVKKMSSEEGVTGKDAARDIDRGERGFGGERSWGFGRGMEVGNYCVRLRGLPWEAKKVKYLV